MSARARGAGDAIPDLPPALARELASYIHAVAQRAARAAHAHGDPDPWVGHREWVRMGICPSLRSACALARSGQIAGVKCVGSGRSRSYLVRRSALDAWIEAHSIQVTGEEPDDDFEFEQEMAKRGLHAGTAGRAGR